MPVAGSCSVQRAVFGQPAWAPGPLAEHRRRGRGFAGAPILALATLSGRSDAGATSKSRSPQGPLTAALHLPRAKELRDAIDLTQRRARCCERRPLAQKSRYTKYPPVAAAEHPRRPPERRQRFPGAYVGRRCKRGKNLAPQNARRGRLKDPTRTTKNGPNTTATVTGAPLRLLRRARASEKPAPAESFETTSRE